MKKVQTPDQVVLGDKTALVENIFHQGLKKTAMQELIDEIIEHLTYDDYLSDDSRTTYETIRLRCLNKLSVEKEQMMDAYKEGCFDNILDESTDKIRAEQYYNETYGK
jgi:DNA primase